MSGKLVCKGSWNTGRSIRVAGLFQRIQLRHVRGFRLRARATISHFNSGRHFPGDALVPVPAGFRVARVLSLLSFLGGNHILARRAGDCPAAFGGRVGFIGSLHQLARCEFW